VTPLVLVVTPGVGLGAYQPLLDGLRDRGFDPDVVTFPCSGDFRAFTDRVGRRIAAAPTPPIVVAHGLGATIALGSAPADVDRWVLLAPVLAVPHGAAWTELATRSVGARVDLGRPEPWNGAADLRAVLLGDPLPALGCFPAALARDVQGWIRADVVPLDLAAIDDPVWIAVGLLDEVAPVEVVIPASRRIPERELVRLGVTHFDPVDYGHAGMLGATAPVRAAVRAASREAPSQARGGG
jgi:pimeloyl-ACP methyl ester carboxylesterase